MKVSVVVPAFNAEKYLKECLQSILHQTLRPYELLVVNDGSTDNTLQIAEKYTENVITQENGGIGSARACGAKFAKGDFLAFLSADDAYNPHFLELMEQQRKNPDEILFSNYWICNEHLQPQKVFTAPQQNIRARMIEYALQQNMFVNFSTVIIPKQVFNKVKFDETLRYGEDLIFLLETLVHDISWVHVQQPLVYYRVHSQAGTFTGWSYKNCSNLWRKLAPVLVKLGVQKKEVEACLRRMYWHRFHPVNRLVQLANKRVPSLWQSVKKTPPLRIGWKNVKPLLQ